MSTTLLEGKRTERQLEEKGWAKAEVETANPLRLTSECHVIITPETVEKAFGKGAWEILSQSLVYLGALRNFANSRTLTNLESI